MIGLVNILIYRTSWRFDMLALMQSVEPQFQYWYKNMELQDHLSQVQTVLNQIASLGPISLRLPVYTFAPCSKGHPSAIAHVDLIQLTRRNIPQHIPGRLHPPALPDTLRIRGEDGKSASAKELSLLLQEFCNHQHTFQQRYGEDLTESLENLLKNTCPTASTTWAHPEIQDIAQFQRSCMAQLQDLFNFTQNLLHPSNLIEQAMHMSGQWPRLTLRSLLSKLTYGPRAKLPEEWQKVLSLLAQAIVQHQRSQRLLRLASGGHWEDYSKEMESEQLYDGPPDWLLIQVC
jgi:hypothetical protein